MKNFICLFLVLYSAQNIFAQSGWQYINPTFPGSNQRNGIQFINQNTGYIYGLGLLKTTSGGVFWFKSNSPGIITTSFFTDANTGFCTHSTSNNIYKTTNSGFNWTPVFNYGGVYNEINFYNQNIGGAVTGAGKIITTTDAGATWATEINLGPYMTSINYFNSTTGYVFTSLGDYYKTTNSGVNWFTVPFYGLVRKSKFINSTTGFAVGDLILKTTDAGVTWVPKGSSGGSTIKGIVFPTSSTGYILSNEGGVRYTTNGGENWSSQSLGGGNYSGIAYINSTTGYITQLSGAVLKTTNNGANWFDGNRNLTTQTIRRVQQLDANTVWATGDAGELNRSTDGGITWESVNTGMQAPANWFQFINNLTGWVCDDVTNFKRTTDGGNTWVSYPIIGALDVLNFTFINANTGWACCYQSGRIFKTTNSGTNWTLDYNQTETYPSKIFFVNQLTGWRLIGGNISGNLQRTTNGGTNWSTGISSYQRNMFFINENTGWAYGGYVSGLLKTTNGGLNWLSLPGINNVSDVFFFNDQTGWAAGGSAAGILSRTTNGGLNWVSTTPQLNDSMVCVSFSDANTGWASGINGTLIKTTSGGIVSVSHPSVNVPEKYLLKQNYPNPFNPSTRINYELKITNYVTLKVFDLLGKEVASLVNEKQNAGSYTIDFNSTELNLPSGIYFYTLKTDAFVETKKMILVK